MPLIIAMREGDVCSIDGENFRLKEVAPDRQSAIFESEDGWSDTITVKDEVEVQEDVFVSLSHRLCTTPGQVRVSIAAPREVEILRADAKNRKPKER